MAEVSTEQRNQPAVIFLPIGEHGSCAWFVRVFQEIVTLEGWSLLLFLKKRTNTKQQNQTKTAKTTMKQNSHQNHTVIFLLPV